MIPIPVWNGSLSVPSFPQYRTSIMLAAHPDEMSFYLVLDFQHALHITPRKLMQRCYVNVTCLVSRAWTCVVVPLCVPSSPNSLCKYECLDFKQLDVCQQPDSHTTSLHKLMSNWPGRGGLMRVNSFVASLSADQPPQKKPGHQMNRIRTLFHFK